MAANIVQDQYKPGACSASIPGPGVCRNGFRQSAQCHGLGFTCPCCGKAGQDVPQCLQEDVPPTSFSLWFNETGLPLLAHRSTNNTGSEG